MIYDWKRLLLHIPHGLFNAALVLIEEPSEFTGTTLAAMFCLGFLTFELAEERVLHDKAFHDLVGWLIGLTIGAGTVAMVGVLVS